jgi:hypothetical protein
MFRSNLVRLAAISALSTTMACAVDTPLTPGIAPGSTSAPADGSTLKVGAPTLVSPANNAVVQDQRPTLSVNPVTAQFSSIPLQYEFELQNDTGVPIVRDTVNGTSYQVPALVINTAYRWRARATYNGGVGPFSNTGRFTTPNLTTPTVSSGDAEWRTWFFALIQLRNVGPNTSVEGLAAMEPDLTTAGVLVQKTSAGQIRPRIYLPTGNPNNLYGRTVDLGDLGKPWQWLPRGSTTCEGICK